MIATFETEPLVLRRNFSAKPEIVFKVWTTPEFIRQWFRPSEEFRHTLLEYDLRVGGNYRVGFKGPEGNENVLRGLFLEVSPPHRLVYSWMWEKPDDHAGIPSKVPNSRNRVMAERRRRVVPVQME